MSSAVCLDSNGVSGHPISLQENLEHSVAVIVGKAEDKTDLHEDAADPKGITARVFRVRLIQLLRGNVPETFDIRDENDSGRFGFEVGKEYLLFVERYGPRWPIPLTDAYFVSNCGNSGPVAERSDLLRRLTGFATADQRLQLEKALSAWSGSEAPIHFRFALVDLNDDGIPDALVLAIGPEYCGSGGCELVVLRGNPDGSFQAISSSTVTREPVSVLKEEYQGWHTLTVSIAGGGVRPCQARMPFNGIRYPANPTLATCATGDDLQSASVVTLTP